MDVSVIVPVLDTPEDLLRRALDSAASQAGGHGLEIVVCDDGSRRRPPAELHEIVQDVADRYAVRSRVVHHRAKAGPSAARNTAAAAAHGEYLLWLDSDDLLPPGSIDRLVRAARSEDAKIVVSRCRVVGFDKKVVGFDEEGGDRDPAPYLELARKHRGTLHDPLAQVVFSVQAQLVRREAYENVGGFDPRLQFAEVTDLFLRLVAEVGVDAVHVEPFIGYHYIRRRSSYSYRNRSAFEAARLQVLSSYAREHVGLPPGLSAEGLQKFARARDGAQHYRFVGSDGRHVHPEFHDKFKYHPADGGPRGRARRRGGHRS